MSDAIDADFHHPDFHHPDFHPKSLIIFDWDGTLMDSIGLIVTAMQHAAQENGLTVSDHATKGIIGIALAEAITLLFAQHPDKHDAILASYAKFYTQHCNNDKLFDGVSDLLKRLHAQGKILAIATGKKRQGLQRVLPHSGIESLFTLSKTADETAGKPNPLMLEQILAETGKTLADAIMVGDSVHDIRMSNALTYAGETRLDSIAVSYGCETVEMLAKANPTALVNSVAELGELLALL